MLVSTTCTQVCLILGAALTMFISRGPVESGLDPVYEPF